MPGARCRSLQTVDGDDLEPMDYCSFLPGLGENKHKRVLIQFGESNCVFTLRGCQPVSRALLLTDSCRRACAHTRRPSASVACPR